MPYKVIHKVFEDEEYAEEYALEAQDGRRNITQFKYTEKEIRRSFLKERNEAKKRQGARNDQWVNLDCKDSVNNIPHNYGEQIKNRENETDRKLAEKAGVNLFDC